MDETTTKQLVRQAISLRVDQRAFDAAWPPLPIASPMPIFTWEQLERQLASLAAHPQAAAMAPILLSATRKMARWKSPEMVLREILCLACVLMDDAFQPSVAEGEMT